ncbi:MULTISPECIES: helix-turn-helix domain-containing protein [Acinetobacter]|uniref:DNA-binding protein n=1 Tax=Acinetobacter bouvetii TaxID=202951 RepID=A0A4Q7B121_9GAMM|nr:MULTISPECIES: helix-turn-helix domain-containing protein [Acinetobacter]RZG66666.1 DNA-binding protein [Acinetobacter bouvetii]TCB74001.1 DNA-binding protein [Acinetobacter sp. ANC 4177]
MSKVKFNEMSQQDKDLRLDRFLAAPDQQLFPQEDIAIYLSCSTHTLQRLRCVGGGIPYTKVGRSVAYKKSDVLAYLQRQTVINTAQLVS